MTPTEEQLGTAADVTETVAYVHGGWIALTFDEVLGIANIDAGHPGMTGRLTVRYLKPSTSVGARPARRAPKRSERASG